MVIKETDSIIGKLMKAFEFSDGPGYNERMQRLEGNIGTIIKEIPRYGNKRCFEVKFEKGPTWMYPYPEILSHIIDEKTNVDQLFKDIHALTSSIQRS